MRGQWVEFGGSVFIRVIRNIGNCGRIDT